MAIPWISPKSYSSANVNAGDQATAAQYNALVTDVKALDLPPTYFTVYYAYGGAAMDLRVVDDNNSSGLYTDDRNYLAFAGPPASSPHILHAIDMRSGGDLESRATTTDMAAADRINGVVKIGSYVYALLYDNGAPSLELWRYNANDLTTATQMTIAGTAFGASVFQVFSDGVNLYFQNGAGNSAGSDHVFSKYTISGTTATFDSTITCGAAATNFDSGVAVDGGGNFYGMTAAGVIKRYDSSGTLAATMTDVINNLKLGPVIEGIPYLTYYDPTNFKNHFIRCPLLP